MHGIRLLLWPLLLLCELCTVSCLAYADQGLWYCGLVLTVLRGCCCAAGVLAVGC